MRKIFRSLPLNSVKEIIDSVYEREERSQIPELEEIFKGTFIPSIYYQNLSKEDALTKKIYKKDEEKNIIFPFRKKDFLSRNVEHHGKIGDQTSEKHKETIKQQTALTVKHLEKNLAIGQDEDLLKMTGLLYNSGRKYTAVTERKSKQKDDVGYKYKNKDTGQVGFDEADKLSAYITARAMKKTGVDKDVAAPYISAVYYQSEFKTAEVSEHRVSGSIQHGDKEQFVQSYGEEVYELVQTLIKSSNGVTTYSDLNKQAKTISLGERVIEKELDFFAVHLDDREPRTVDEIRQKYLLESDSDEFEQDLEKVNNYEREAERLRQSERETIEWQDDQKKQQEEVRRKELLERQNRNKIGDIGFLIGVAGINAKAYNRKKHLDKDIQEEQDIQNSILQQEQDREDDLLEL